MMLTANPWKKNINTHGKRLNTIGKPQRNSENRSNAGTNNRCSNYKPKSGL